MRSLLLLLLLGASACAQTTDWDAGPNPSPDLEEAQFRWWVPDGLAKIRGVLVVIPGSNGDAREAVNDAEWRALVSKQSFALMGVRLFKAGRGPAYQGDPDGKTSDTIIRAVAGLAAASGHREAANAPLAFWGHSAGSNTAERFALRNPRRMIGVVGIKGTWGPGEATSEKCGIPFLCTIGKADNPDWVETSCRNYEQGKLNRAVWTLAFHQKEGHEAGGTKPLAVTFLDEVITLRLGDPGSPAAPQVLMKPDLTSGWLGDPESLDAAPFRDFQGRKRTATWLPGPQTAAAWQTYLKGIQKMSDASDRSDLSNKSQ